MLSITVLSIVILSASAQPPFSVTPTGKHVKYWKFAEQGKDLLSKEEKKEWKDSLRQIRKEGKLSGQELDCYGKVLRNHRIWEAKLKDLQRKGNPMPISTPARSPLSLALNLSRQGL